MPHANKENAKETVSELKKTLMCAQDFTSVFEIDQGKFDQSLE